MSSCNHTIGYLSDMVTYLVTSDAYFKRCKVCGEEEVLRRAGKIWTGYSIKAETKRDFDRREYAKDILQPNDRKGNVSELFDHAYGSPYKKAEVGTLVDKYRIKDEK